MRWGRQAQCKNHEGAGSPWSNGCTGHNAFRNNDNNNISLSRAYIPSGVCVRGSDIIYRTDECARIYSVLCMHAYVRECKYNISIALTSARAYT